MFLLYHMEEVLAKANRNSSPTYSLGYRPSHSLRIGDFFWKAVKIPEGLNGAKAKILVTVGEKEKGMMKKSAEDITLSHSNCTGIIIPNVGHGISLASPEFFNHLIEEWVQDR